MKKRLSFVIFLISFSVFSQSYVALDTTDYIKRDIFLKKIDNDFELLEKQIKKRYKGKLRKGIISSFNRIHKDISKNIKKKRLVFHDTFTSYIDSLSDVIIKNNKDLIDEKIYVYVHKQNSPNALSLGRGIILLNMGLFSLLENEQQLTSVLTHEIAHQLLNHTENTIVSRVKTETSKEKKQQVKRIKKKRYSTHSEAFSVLKNILYNNSKNRRKQEVKADSLGFILYKNTKLSFNEYLQTLHLLKNYDSLPNVKVDSTVYRKFFDLPSQPFNNEWLTVEDFKSYNYEHYNSKIDSDSLKSHPELDERIKYLKKTFSNDLDSSNNSSQQASSSFEKLKEIANQESIINLFYNEAYGLSIYSILARLDENPENAYYKKWLGINFNKLYEAKKKYQYNRHVDKIVPNEQDRSYQQFLSFLWNLRLNEIKHIAEYYIPKKSED
ncbi:M48 family metalloprotease [Tenacibaculum sp. MEBiC06402]|uniref:M48 family metalloprotease n=1 Tax=unclassified Tenacibaculum TaxID=2635139 RepID=UPI003B9C859F